MDEWINLKTILAFLVGVAVSAYVKSAVTKVKGKTGL